MTVTKCLIILNHNESILGTSGVGILYAQMPEYTDTESINETEIGGEALSYSHWEMLVDYDEGDITII